MPGTDNLLGTAGLTQINGLADGGGAIFNINGGLTLSDLMISNCQDSNAGGAIFAFGPLTMRECTVSNNSVNGGGAGGGKMSVLCS